MQIITDGLVLKENNVGDNDRVITVLTRDYGVLRAFSVGARRIKSKKNASTSLLAYSKFTFSGSMDKLRVDDAVPVEMFFDLRSNILNLSIAQYICELCQNLAPTEENAEEYLRLALNTLHFLSKSDSNPYLLKSIAELRLMTISGYQPDLVACRECGCFENDKMYFDISDASIVCDECIDAAASSYLAIDRSILAAMRHIVFADFNKLFSFSIHQEKSKYLSTITEKYLCDKLERGFKTLDFLHSIDF